MYDRYTITILVVTILYLFGVYVSLELFKQDIQHYKKNTTKFYLMLFLSSMWGLVIIPYIYLLLPKEYRKKLVALLIMLFLLVFIVKELFVFDNLFIFK